MAWAEIFTDNYIVGFILLFFRLSAIFISVPIFSHKNIPMNIKATMAFFFAIVFYPSMPPLSIEINTVSLIIAILSELFFGSMMGLILMLAYNVITFAGGIISSMMGFSMASAIDPQSGISMPIISQFLSLMALMILLSIDMHHWILMYIDKSLSLVPLGVFRVDEKLFKYIISATSNMFLVGLMISFPIVALAWLADMIFGMLMKTMPQFNLLVIGFPIKIMVSFGVLIATFTATMLIVKNEMISAFNVLEMFF